MLFKHFIAVLLALTVMSITPAQAEEEMDCGHPQMKGVLACQQGIAYLTEERQVALAATIKAVAQKTAPKPKPKPKAQEKIDFSNLEESFSLGKLY